jgi:hypothetical protein
MVKAPVRLAHRQRVAPLTMCDITFDLARHKFQGTFYVLRYLRVVDLVLGLPWLGDEQAT